MDKDEVKLKHKVQIRRKKPEKKGFAAPVIDFFKKNTISCIIGGLVVAGAAITIAFWPKGEVTPPTPPAVVDSLENVVDTPAVKEVVKESDTVSNVQKVTPINEGVDKKQDEVPSETPEAKEAPKAKTVTTSTKSSNTRSGDVTVDAKKAIRGDFGNGAERRRQLGDDYEQVQALVNKMYREGKLYW